MRGHLRRPFTKNWFDIFPPAFIDADERPRNAGRDIAQDSVGCGVDPQGGSDQEKQRWIRRELYSGKIPEFLELASLMVPADARPIIKALQGQMYVFIGFKLDDREPALAGAGKDINHRAIRG